MTVQQKAALRQAEATVSAAVKVKATTIDLRGSGLTELPENLLNATSVATLNIHNASLEALPSWLVHLPSLKTLQLFRSGLRRLPEWIGEMRNIDCLNISAPHRVEGLEMIAEMPALKTLILQNGPLPNLPDIFSRLKRLSNVMLLNLDLTALPESIEELTNLRALNVETNKLSSLPECISSLSKLESLNLSQNRFSTVPPILHHLPALKGLTLTENPDLQIPQEILASNDAAKILAYASRLRGSGQREPLNEAKMILVGRGAVGKTTLVHQLVHGKYVQKSKTKGIKVSQWKIPGPEGDITTHVWDFGGQEIMHGTHQFFLTERSLYLLVLAGREDREDEDAEYWLKMIGAFGGDSPVIVVLNKIKEHHFDLNEEALREKFPNIVAFLDTDCKPPRGKVGSGFHIAKLRQLIIDRIAEMESVRAHFPAAWRDIKGRLTDMRENFMSFDRFRAMCEEYGEKSTKEQEELAHYLHLLGVALNYRDDPRLRETSVLNPKWVTTGIYKLLNDPTIKKRRGLLRLSDFSRVLPAKDYPKDMHEFLLRLMKKFELCFPLDDEGREHLIPELLGKKQPMLGDEFDIERCLCFEYHYGSLLPEGLLPRFIVRAYTRIEEDLRWRTGVVLEWKGARALVKADEAERQVLIRVRGTRDQSKLKSGEGLTESEHIRRELLALIREHFDAIHRNFKRLEPVEKIRIPEIPRLLIEYRKLEALKRQRRVYVEEFWEDEVFAIEIRPQLQKFDLPGAKDDATTRGAATIKEPKEEYIRRSKSSIAHGPR